MKRATIVQVELQVKDLHQEQLTDLAQRAITAELPLLLPLLVLLVPTLLLSSCQQECTASLVPLDLIVM